MDAIKAKAPDAVKPKSKIELFSPTYFAACTLGGIIGTFLFSILLHKTLSTPMGCHYPLSSQSQYPPSPYPIVV
jgi:hypothetical protein